MATSITFGTDGWRGVIAADFTFDNVAVVSEATANFFKKHKKIRNGVIVGYDSRFLSREFAQTAATVLANRGIRVLISDAISSTPMVSLLAKKLNAAGGIVITASHNPARYNGFKIKGDFGGPAHPEMIAAVEKELKKVSRSKRKPGKTYDELVGKGKIELLDFTTMYVEDIRKKIDIERIKSAGLRIAFDAMFGAGQGVMGRLIPLTASRREIYNPGFGGAHPEPLPQHLTGLREAVLVDRCDIGIATDGDADRLGVYDERGEFVDSHRIFALLLKYLVKEKKWTGEVAKSFSVSSLIDKMCAKYGLTLHETKVGFKYLCRLMTDRDILIAAEESGGLGVKGHLPERDGIFNGLLLAELMATRKMRLSELVEEIMNEFGWHYFNRYDARLTEKEKVRILKVYKKGVKQLAGMPVQRVETKDGFKLFVEHGWVLVRASGTEPLIRFYAEADAPTVVEALLTSARSV
jgi:phosphomannomutase